MLRNRPLPPLLAAIGISVLVAGCNEEPANPSGDDSAAERPAGFTHPEDLVEGEDGLFRLEGETEPYTGPAIIRDRDWNLRYFAFYQKGKLHGPEMKFWEDNVLRRNFDYEAGEKIRHREWFENGNPKIDATMVDGVAMGQHRTWFEDGRIRWSGAFVENLRWDGPIIDYNEDGEIMWKGEFDNGRFLEGIYPEEAQADLIKSGAVKPEDALYPIEPKANPGESGDEAASDGTAP